MTIQFSHKLTRRTTFLRTFVYKRHNILQCFGVDTMRYIFICDLIIFGMHAILFRRVLFLPRESITLTNWSHVTHHNE